MNKVSRVVPLNSLTHTIPESAPEYIVLTPVMAQEFLDNKAQNRRISEAHVRTLADTILAGGWSATHQGLAFDKDGRLIDGQHRCSAVVKANRPVVILATRGLSSTAARAIDQGSRPRSVADWGNMSGVENANKKQFICRSLAHLINRTGIKITPTSFDEIYAKFGRAIEETIRVVSESPHKRLHASLGAATAYAYDVAPGPVLKTFAKIVNRDVFAGEPAAAMLRLDSDPSSSQRALDTMAKFLRGYQAAIQDQPIDVLRTGGKSYEWFVQRRISMSLPVDMISSAR